MKRRDWFKLTAAFGTVQALGKQPVHFGELLPVSLKEAHKGTLEIDLRMMNQFVRQSPQTIGFYTKARAFYCGESPVGLPALCHQFKRPAVSGPILGDLSETGVTVWMHLAEPDELTVTIQSKGQRIPLRIQHAADDCTPRVRCEPLVPDTLYRYAVHSSSGVKLGEGRFKTSPEQTSKKRFQIAFGSDFHKIGLHRPELMNQMRERGNRIAILAGDLAVDGRRNNEGLIRSDYLLRDSAPGWQKLAANVPVYATWDDHDYFANDAHGTEYKGEKVDVDLLRSLWKEHWNNPAPAGEGLYFSMHIGPVHVLMLDTRSCRENVRQGEYGSFLGKRQTAWVLNEIESSTAPFLILSGGTMWSDYISGGKDSWHRWDEPVREEIFSRIDAKTHTRVVLLSGDRHGARGFAIPRPCGKPIYELEAGSMGGVPGPAGYEKNKTHQLFGYTGLNFWAYGELEFYFDEAGPQVDFSLIGDGGNVLETLKIGRPQ